MDSHTDTQSNTPVLIPIHSSSQDEAPEWAMIEINGELLLPSSSASSSNSHGMLELGALDWDEQGLPRMIVGSHELQGKVEKLQQPYCVLQKQTHHDDTNNSRVSYSIQGIITQKLLFNSYPKTIMR